MASQRITKASPEYNKITYDDIKNCKLITDADIKGEFVKLRQLKCDTNTRSFCGNKIIYHFMLEHMLKTRRDKKGYKLLSEIFDDEEAKKKLIDRTIKMNRRKKLDYIEPVDIYECFRFCKGSVNTFKAGTTRYLVKRFKATTMLDFTAGWGGRMLGAISRDVNYIGIETNTNLRAGYKAMGKIIWDIHADCQMIWHNCLDVDFSTLDYDFVLTSPPYINLEMYEEMPLFKDKEAYYTEFLIPMINKCLNHIKNNGAVCINISNYMYDDYIEYGGVACVEKIDLLQQMGGKPNKEIVYVFRKPEEDDSDDEVWDETCNCCGKNLSDIYGYKLTEEEFDEHPERDDGYDEDGQWFCPDCRD